MVKGGVFTDGEVLARAKNRQEDKTLSFRLKHLQLQEDLAKDTIAKERKTLLESSRTTRLSSGKSPVVGDVGDKRITSHRKPALASSNHFRKPWALSSTETSFNAQYNDEFDPYVCRRASIQVSRPIQVRNGSAPAGERQRIKSLRNHRPLTSHTQRSCHRTVDTSEQGHTSVSRNQFWKSTVSSELNTCIKGESNDGHGLKPKKMRPKSVAAMDRPCVSMSSSYNDTAWEERIDHRVLQNHRTDAASLKLLHNDNKCSKGADEGIFKPKDTPTESRDNEHETSGDESETERANCIIYKGKKIRNYVKPQDRYKRDPFKDVRRERLIRHLSLENPIFLNGTREQGIRIYTTISRAARESALRRLVEQNRIHVAASRRPVFNNMELERRVKEFCQSSEM